MAEDVQEQEDSDGADAVAEGHPAEPGCSMTDEPELFVGDGHKLLPVDMHMSRPEVGVVAAENLARAGHSGMEEDFVADNEQPEEPQMIPQLVALL